MNRPASPSELYLWLHGLWQRTPLSEGWWLALWAVIVAAVIMVFVLLTVLVLVWVERKVSGDIQSRIGPARVGTKFGLLQTAADALKLLIKEDIIPVCADKALFVVAPFVVFVPCFMVYVVLPFGDRLVAQDLDLGVLYVVAVSALPALGFLMAGWGSNNKYAVIGGMRAVAQLMTYEIPLGLSLLAVVMAVGSLSTVAIVAHQSGWWHIASPPLFVAFVIYFICALAENNRVPFDLPEAEAELVAGYHVEYSGMRWAIFFMGEYGYMFFVAAFGATLFLGGWHGPFLPPVLWFLIKTYALILAIMWVRWTYPRLRIDQIMRFGWKVLVPVALLNLIWAGFWFAR
ncbi:MAG: NADH-quinone oxidoreductase subunit NuoH [Armatimonadota bacterium]|nr:MAG: NADH-quinone oxidoreductase subunit NuoH [Armatimonadota bacterium]